MPNPAPLSRRCAECGARLARDNHGRVCASCQRRHTNASGPTEAPDLSLDFWSSDAMRSVLETWHIGRVIRAYRVSIAGETISGGVVSQETVAHWLGISQTQLSRVENGEAVTDLGKLIPWARA